MSEQDITKRFAAQMLGVELAPEGEEPPAGSPLAVLNSLVAAEERGEMTPEQVQQRLRDVIAE